MPRYAPNKMSIEVKRRYFELIRFGVRGSVAAREVGVSVSCGSVWFVEAGRVHVLERPSSPRYFNQNDRIEIADGLAAGRSVKVIAALLGKSYQSVYREIAQNRKADGIYQPWYAHSQAYLRRRRPKSRRFADDAQLRDAVAARLQHRWLPAQIAGGCAGATLADPAGTSARKRSTKPSTTDIFGRWTSGGRRCCVPAGPTDDVVAAADPVTARSGSAPR
jgi:IS30 family transposase